MAKKKRKNNSINEAKLELAKSIAETSKSIRETYANFESQVIKVFRNISTWVDYVLFNERFSKLVAVCLATILYLIINADSKDVAFMNNMKQTVTIENVSVITNISDSVYEITGLPETVNIDVKGDASDVQFASQQRDNYKVLADLSDLEEGVHNITLEPLNFSSKVEVSVNPSTVEVQIKKKVTNSFTLGYEFINTNKSDKVYAFSEPEFSQRDVIVKASQDKIEQISSVKALIDISDKTEDFTQEAVIVAYDQQGNSMDVDILPQSVTVSVKVTKPSKKVPLVMIPEGEMEEGLSIESYELSEEYITIYAPEDVLSKIDKIELKVPVNKITETTTVKMSIMLPEGVSKASVSKVSVYIKVQKAESKIFDDIPIKVLNLDEKFNLKLPNEGLVSVVVKGATEQLEKITASDIEVTLDLAEYSVAGKLKATLKVSGTNTLLTYSLENKVIEIELEEK